MKKGRFLARWAGVVAVLAALSAYAIEAVGVVPTPPSGGDGRADILMIDSLAAFGALEEAPVAFRHDQHTEALAKLGKTDCTTCHESDKDRLVLKFKRLADTDAATVKAVYHDNCIGCHKDLAAQGQPTGPTDVACRSCHSTTPVDTSAWTPIGMDKSLHFRHLDSKSVVRDAENRTCAACHHEYDQASKKLVYAKNKEDSCAACHGPLAVAGPDGDVRALRDAAHLACVSCHVQVTAKGADSGPATCQGCHTAQAQAAVKVVTNVPRLERGQADAVLMGLPAAPAQGARPVKGFMSPVAFDHKSHEGYVKDCRSCHHEKIASCSAECHTRAGSDKGGFVTLEQAMHKVSAQESCVGCHNQRAAAPECAGCHNLMPTARASLASCATCHDKALEPASPEAALAMTDQDKTALALGAISARKPVGTYNLDEIPETVAIGDLADKYEPAEFPHRKIAQTMLKLIGDSPMAARFHREQGTFCQGCHHNSPASATPPRCASCHAATPGTGTDARPGLMTAFHQQCIGCHQAMGLEKPAATACADCHKERKK